MQSQRRTFCSQDCVDEWLIRTDPAFARRKVHERDHGVCSRCGTDTDTLEKERRSVWDHAKLAWWRPGENPGARQPHEVLADWNDAHGLRRSLSACAHLWEAHHTVAVVEGGGECGLEGLETLCRACHAQETSALARRQAERRRQKGNAQMGSQDLPVNGVLQ